MKVYIKSAVSIENLKKQFGDGMSNRTFADIVNIDPTADYDTNRPSKYGVWLFNQNKKGNLQRADYQAIHDALDKFSKDSSKFKHADIGRYRTVAEFLEDAQQVMSLLMTEEEKARQLKKDAHHASSKDKRFIAEDGDWELWMPMTYAGSISLARKGGEKAEWCTAYEGDDSYWEQYTDEGNLYIFINTVDPGSKYQLHFESEQFCDFYDDNEGLESFFGFIENKPSFKEFFSTQSDYLYAVNHRSDDDDYDEDEDDDDDDYEYNAPVVDPFIEDNIDGALAGFNRDTTYLDLSSIEAERLGSRAFSQFTALREVKLPKNLQELGRGAFASCPDLRRVEFSSNLQVIGSGAFEHCNSIRRITLPDSVETISDEAFAYCDALKSIRLPAGLKTIGNRAFYGCKSIHRINLPEGLQTIRSGAFGDCTSLKTIEIPDSLQSIGTQVFLGCIRLSRQSVDSIRRFCDRTGTNLLGVMRQRMWG